jgi:hypothetical protein
MSKIVLFTAANPVAASNLRHSVVEGVDIETLADSRMFEELETRSQGGKIHLWGSSAGATGRKLASWRRVDPPAIAFFYSDGRFGFTARIWAKEPVATEGLDGNPDLAQAVWGDSAFEHIVYLEEVESVDVTADQLKAALGYEMGYPLGRESVVPNDEAQAAIIAAFGSAEAFRDAVVGHVGTPPLDDLPATGLPVATLGTAYRTANEDAKAERNESFTVDPDVVDRGTQAHARTQNLLAQHLEGQGAAPRSPSVAEPPYDLAWQVGDTIFVAEIKSLTRQNEERQLRLALGQILRYAQQLTYKGKPIQKVIALEREPRDTTWTELCAIHNVRLLWPDTFADL